MPTPASAESIDDLFAMSLEELLQVPITVSSTKKENIFESVSTVSILTEQHIQQYGFRSVGEAIQTLAGIDVLRTYFKKNIATSRGILQDHYANKVLLMINKMPTVNGATGEAILDKINIRDVERIEVLKGPASVLYGTNAYSGAINIVLKGANSKKTQASLGLGSSSQYIVGASTTIPSADDNSGLFLSAYSSKSERNRLDFTDETGVLGDITDFDDIDTLTVQGRYKSHDFLINGYQGAEGYLGVAPRFSFGAGNQHELDGYMVGYRYSYVVND